MWVYRYEEWKLGQGLWRCVLYISAPTWCEVFWYLASLVFITKLSTAIESRVRSGSSPGTEGKNRRKIVAGKECT
jgi:hypothetical protein